MSKSETSSEHKIEYQNSHGQRLIDDKPTDKKPQTTDTDYYHGMIANPNKLLEEPKDDSTSELNELLKDTETSRSSSSRSSKSSKSSSSEKRTSDSKSKVEQLSIGGFMNRPSHTQVNYPQMPNNNHTQNYVKPNEPIQSMGEQKILTPQEMRMKKIELLRKLSEIKLKGFQLSKDYDFNSSIEEMEYEYDLLRSFVDKRNGIKIFKNGLLQAVSVIEFLNDKYDPFDFHLSGWGEHLSVEVDSWEDVLEELYEKYRGTGRKMAPEIKLLFLIIASASAFHFSKSQASKLPGLDSVLASNPGLLSKIINPNKETSQFMSPQELNIEKQKEELRKKEQETKQQFMAQQQANQQNMIKQLQEQIQKQNDMISNMNQNNFGASLNPNFNSGPQAANVKTPITRPNIRAPDQVKDILNRMHSLPNSTIKQSLADTQDETSSNNDRLVSESTVSESNPRKRGRKTKKSNISII
jgi:hypothetical protein